MVFNNFNNTFYINGLDTILMNGQYEHDVCLSEYMMTSAYAVKQEIFSFKQFPNIRKRDVVRTLSDTLEKFFTLAHKRKTNILHPYFLDVLVNHNWKLRAVMFRDKFLSIKNMRYRIAIIFASSLIVATATFAQSSNKGEKLLKSLVTQMVNAQTEYDAKT